MKLRQKIWLLPRCAAVVFSAGNAVSFAFGTCTSALLDALRDSAYPAKERPDQVAAHLDRFRSGVQAAAAEGDAAGELKRSLDAHVPAALQAAQAMATNQPDANAKVKAMVDAGKALDDRLARAKGLITVSSGKVEVGARRVNDPEQSSGIGNVNQSVGQLDQMTQQNAALVQRSAASAAGLRDQAKRLVEAVAAFRTGSWQARQFSSSAAVASSRRAAASGSVRSAAAA